MRGEGEWPVDVDNVDPSASHSLAEPRDFASPPETELEAKYLLRNVSGLALWPIFAAAVFCLWNFAMMNLGTYSVFASKPSR